MQLAEICSKYETKEDIAVLKEAVSSNTSELEFENLDEAMAVRCFTLSYRHDHSKLQTGRLLLKRDDIHKMYDFWRIIRLNEVRSL